MYGNATTRGGESIRRYRCRDYNNMMIKVGCGKVFRTAEPLETFVKDAIFYRLQSHDLAELLSSGDRLDVAPVMKVYEKRKRRLDGLVDDYASGLLNRSQFAKAKEIAENALEETRQDLARLQSQLTGLSIPPGKTLEQAWDARGVQWRHAFVKLLIEKIVVSPGHPGSGMYKGWRFNPDHIAISWKA
jgi:site-specific DNA recombinase